MKILLPDSIELHPELPDGVTAVTYNTREPLPDEHLDAEVLVVHGYSRKHLEQAARSLQQLRLVQSLAAGPDTVVAAGFDPSVQICSGVGLHDLAVSEHAIALALALVRRFPTTSAAQREHRWARELGGFRDYHAGRPVESLDGAKVLVWGFGSIGAVLARRLATFGARVRGVARTAGVRQGFQVVTEESLSTELADTDVLVLILPHSDETRNALDATRIAQLPEGAFVVNVGRGTTVDEDALIAALRSGHLAGAALDVMQVEPLPEDSPLWDAPNTILTPHSAGGRPVGTDDLIAANVAALRAGGQLRNLVE